MAKYIIVEGPDGAGKTTYIKQLMEQFPRAVYGHFDAPATDQEAFNYWRVYAEFIKTNRNADVVILDRSWYSDMVYAPIFRGREEMTPENMETLELLVKACGGGFIIYCTAAPRILWKRCQQRGEDYVTSSIQLKTLRNKYEEVMKKAIHLPVFRIDTGVKW